MALRRVGLWLIGALGGVGATTALGLSALRRGLTSTTGLVTALPMFANLDLDQPADIFVGGHDIRAGDLATAAANVGRGTPAFSTSIIDACRDDLASFSNNIRPGFVVNADAVAAHLVDRGDVDCHASPPSMLVSFQRDLTEFQKRHRLDQIVVVNLASTEPPAVDHVAHQSLTTLRKHLDDATALPASSWYALAALEAGYPYINFTPSCGADLPSLVELALQKNLPIAGRDGKTGETLVKSVLAPLFAIRNLRVLSWVGHNILGNRDGFVLSEPTNRASKLKSKDQVVASILGYQPQTHTSIEYVESLDDWKTAWDHIHFEGFLGVRMALQFTWQGCDSALAAPLVIDLSRLTLLAQRAGMGGVLDHLALFFKSPMGVTQHDLGQQYARLTEYVRQQTNQ